MMIIVIIIGILWITNQTTNHHNANSNDTTNSNNDSNNTNSNNTTNSNHTNNAMNKATLTCRGERSNTRKRHLRNHRGVSVAFFQMDVQRHFPTEFHFSAACWKGLSLPQWISLELPNGLSAACSNELFHFCDVWLPWAWHSSCRRRTFTIKYMILVYCSILHDVTLTVACYTIQDWYKRITS